MSKLDDRFVDFDSFSSNLGKVFIVKPTIITPTDGQTNFSGDIVSSTFQTINGVTLTHQFSGWEISTDLNFTNLEHIYSTPLNC